MTTAWAARIEECYRDELFDLRLHEGLRIAAGDRHWWVIGERLDEDLDRDLRSVPHLVRYDRTGDRVLRRPGEQLPAEILPPLDFIPIREGLSIAPQQVRTAPETVRRGRLSLVRSDRPLPARVLETTFDEFSRWAFDAPELRLHVLRFATSADGVVVVHGEPLPPLSGCRYSERRGVVLPLGWRLAPIDDPLLLGEFFKLADGDLYLLDEDCESRRLPASRFVMARRSAIRATWESLRDE